jgi:hypothetical protein
MGTLLKAIGIVLETHFRFGFQISLVLETALCGHILILMLKCYGEKQYSVTKKILLK